MEPVQVAVHDLDADRDQSLYRLHRLARERRHALANQATTDLAFEAAQRCIENSAADARDIDTLLMATITPDMSFLEMLDILNEDLQNKGELPVAFRYSTPTSADACLRAPS